MELGLSLGEASTRTYSGFTDKNHNKMSNKSLGFCMGLSVGYYNGGRDEENLDKNDEEQRDERRVSSVDPSLHLNLLPLASTTRNQTGFPWISENGNSEVGLRGFDVNRLPSTEEIDDGAPISSPNSTVSSFQIDFSVCRNGNGSKKDSEIAGLNEVDTEKSSSRASDDEEDNNLTRKKLRLSKEQSAFLEESFKEHNTLNPKQKIALAKQLNLRPRQVEVWFQNRRARTKLKQTEVDCEYLKKCCETLTEENRRLQKELQDLRTLKSSNPYYMQLPATTLTMCPSCERVATTNTTTTTNNNNNPNSSTFSLNQKPKFYPFFQSNSHPSTTS